MNQFLIAIYNGVLQESATKKVESSLSSLGISVRTISMNHFTLLVGEELSVLTTGLTDKYYLLTQELQKLEDQDKYYYVYDYKGRKYIENPEQCCFPLIKINIPIDHLQQVIQSVKDIKQKVIAGFSVQEQTGSLTVEVLLTSDILEALHKGNTLPIALNEDSHYRYLLALTETLSKEELINFVETKWIDKLFKQETTCRL
jgi:hypothetical protein